MDPIKKIIKKLPIETYVLGIPAAIFLIIISGYKSIHAELFSQISSTSPVRFVIGFGSGTLQWFAFFILLFVSAKGISYLVTKGSYNRAQIISIAQKGLYWAVLFTLVGTAMQFALNTIFITAQPSRIIEVSDRVLSIDKGLFGMFPAAHLYKYLSGGIIEKLIVYSYTYLSVILAVLFFVLFRVNKHLMRIFFLSFVFAFALAAPIWVFFPALSPQDMYRTNIFQREIPSDIQEADTKLTENMSPFMQSYISKFDKVWISEDKTFYAVSTFPSLHAAWGIIGTVIGIALWPPLAFILIPWCIFNFIATFYVLQHYAIDSFSGILLALISLLLAYGILRLEKKLRS